MQTIILISQKFKNSIESSVSETKNQKHNKKVQLYQNSLLVQQSITNFDQKNIGYCFDDSKALNFDKSDRKTTIEVKQPQNTNLSIATDLITNPSTSTLVLKNANAKRNVKRVTSNNITHSTLNIIKDLVESDTKPPV